MCVERQREKERDGREPTTIRVWFRMRARVRVIWHFVHARFLAFCPDTVMTLGKKI